MAFTRASVALYPLLVLGGGASIVILMSRGATAVAAVLPVTVTVAIAVAVLERWYPYEPGWNEDLGDRAADWIHYFVNYGVKQASLWLYAFLLDHLSIAAGVWPSSWPFAAQAVLALVLVDLCLYAVHRASHESDLLWRFHAIHHSSARLYWVNGEKRHPLHQIAEGLPGVTALMIMGAPARVVVAALAVLGLNMMLQHANIDYRARALRYVFSVAELHRLHHRSSAAESKVNFGAWLAVWDLLFGSYENPDRAAAVRRVGVEDEPEFPTAYTEHLVWPFRDPDSRALRVRGTSQSPVHSDPCGQTKACAGPPARTP